MAPCANRAKRFLAIKKLNSGHLFLIMIEIGFHLADLQVRYKAKAG